MKPPDFGAWCWQRHLLARADSLGAVSIPEAEHDFSVDAMARRVLHGWEHMACVGKAVDGSCVQRQGRDAGAVQGPSPSRSRSTGMVVALEGRASPGERLGRDPGSITPVGCTNTRHDNG